MKKKRYFTDEEFAGLKKLIDNKAEIIVIATGGNRIEMPKEILFRLADVIPPTSTTRQLTLEEITRVGEALYTCKNTRLFIMLLPHRP